jgi:hypothetical protein
VHGRRADICAGVAEFVLPVAAFDKKTRCQQNIVSTGVGGTEVKTSIVGKIRQFNIKSIRMLNE